MNRQEVLEKLCYNDKRNPTMLRLGEEQDSPKEEQECYCDNCFYGRHELAEELLKYMEGDEANALLISKAPEMLEMLKEVIDWEYVSVYNESLYEKIEQLIKEATEL